MAKQHEFLDKAAHGHLCQYVDMCFLPGFGFYVEFDVGKKL